MDDHIKMEKSLYALFESKAITPAKICDCIELAMKKPNVYNPVTVVSWVLFSNVPDYRAQLDNLSTYLNDNTITTPLNNIVRGFIAKEWNSR